MRKFRLGTRLISSYVILAVLLITVAAINLVTIVHLTDDAAHTYYTVIEPIIHMTNFAIPYGQVRSSIHEIEQSITDEENAVHKQLIEDSLDRINTEIGAYRDILRLSPAPDPREIEAVELMTDTLVLYEDVCRNRLIPAGMRNDNEEVRRIIAEDLVGMGILLRAQIDLLTKIQAQKAVDNRDFIVAERIHRIVVSVGIVLSSLLLMVLFSYLILRSILLPMKKIANAAEEITKGSREVQFETGFTDEIGLLSEGFSVLTGTLRRRGIRSDVLNQAALAFIPLADESFKDMMTNGIGKIAGEADLDRVGVYRNFDQFDGLHTGQIYRWDRGSGGSTDIAPRVADLTFSEVLPGWVEILSQGGCINGPIGSSAELALQWLYLFEVRSLLALPIIIQSKFWGVVTFQDHHSERYFDDDTVEMLRSAATLCSSAIIQREMKRSLVESEERIRSIMDAAPLGVLLMDKNLQVIDANGYMLGLFGFNNKQEYGRRFFELMPDHQPDGSNSVKTAVARINRALNGETLMFEWTHMTLLGEQLPTEITLTPMFVNGECQVFCYLYDLRGIKKAAQALSESEARSRIMMDTSPTGCVMINNKFQPFDCNEITTSLFNIPDRQYYLDNFYQLSPEFQEDGSPSPEKARSLMKRALLGETLKFDWMHQTAAKEPLPMEITLTRVMYGGEYVILGHYYDMRKVKEMQRHILEQDKMLRLRLEEALTASRAKEQGSVLP